MKFSASIETIWEMAAKEAISGLFPKIEPEHLFLATLKYSEFGTDELKGMATRSESAEALWNDVERIRNELRKRGLDSKTLGLSIRARLGKGDTPFSGQRISRSPQTRQYFDRADRLAADAGETATTGYWMIQALLESPTPILLAEFPKRVAATPPVRGHEDPALDASESRLAAKALSGVLDLSKRKNVFLVTSKERDAGAVVASVARGFGKPAGSSGRNRKRIIDFHHIEGTARALDRQLNKIDSILGEKVPLREVVFYLPPIGFSKKENKSVEWMRTLKGILREGEMQVICCISPESLDEAVSMDPEWKRLCHPIWIGARNCPAIPDRI